MFWNCGSLNVMKRTAELLAGDADIICLQETQHTTFRPPEFQTLITNEKGHGQIIAIRKSIKHRELDVTRWSSDNLHLIAVKLTEQPVRNIVCVHVTKHSRNRTG